MRETRVCVLALPVHDDLVKNRRFRRSDDLKRELKEVVNEAELEVSPTKKPAREASNDVDLQIDELCSGNSDPIVIQNDNNNNNNNNNTATILENSGSNNNPNDLGVSGNDEVINYGEITSEGSSQSCTLSGFCTSYPTQDYSITEHVRPSGLRIRLKTRHRSSGDYTSKFSNSSAQILSNELNDCAGTDDNNQRALRSWTAGKTAVQQPDLFVAGTKKKRSEGGKKRNDDLHKALFLPNGLADGTCLSYNVKGHKILEGYKAENGIFCNHCSNVVSPSQFEAHAGMASRKKPYQHIFVADGRTLHDIALSLAEVGQTNQTAAPINNECGGIPRKLNSMIMRRRRAAVKKSGFDQGGNCVLCTAHDFSVNKFDDRTVIICDQCEKEYHVGCLREGGWCDLKELPKDKWFCCCDCDITFASLREIVARGSMVIPFSETSKINRRLLDEGLCEVADDDVQWRLLNGKCCLPEDQPLLSKVIYLFRKGFNPITTANGRDLIPAMVNGRNIDGQEFGGMYCVVLTVKSVIVSAGVLRVCGHELAELPLVATKRKYQGKGYFLALFSRIEELLASLKVEKLVLPAAEDAKAMWVNRFGFTEMSQETLCMYTRMFSLTGFHETFMLVKQLEQ